MASNLWYAKVFKNIYTIVKSKMPLNLAKYSINFTSEVVNDTPTRFPTVCINELPAYEIGRDIDNTEINAIEESIRVYVYCNTNMTDCSTIMNEAVLQMKALRFNVTSFPLYSKTNNVVNGVATFRRTIGRGDTDLVIN